LNLNDRDIVEILERLKQIEQMLLRQRGVRTDLADFGSALSGTRPKLSVISPCFNEKENLSNLLSRIRKSCLENGLEEFEIIWVENGSDDGSFDLMQKLSLEEPRLKILQLSRNFGYQGAIACGIAHASGNFVSILDGDIQDPPELIPKMLELAERQNLDVVYGVRTKRQESFLKRFSYAAFYRVWKITAEIDVPLDAGDFCVMRRTVANAINNMPERQRFNRGLRAWVGFRQSGFPYERDSRENGETKFNLKGMVQLALDGIISYSVAPLRTATLVGFAIAAMAFALGGVQGIARLLAYYEGTTFSGVLPPGITQISLVMIGLFGVQIFLMGILGEYLGRVYGEVKDRPLFLVRHKLGFEDQA